MKQSVFVLLLVLVMLPVVVLPLLEAPEPYVWGRIRIPARGIEASVYTREAEPIDGMSSLWQGGTVTTDADLSNVQVGDFAHIYTTEGEHLVLECVSITGIPAWMRKTDGDVLVVNDWLVYRFIRL